MFSFLRRFTKEGEFARILPWPHLDPDRADAAERAIARGEYEDHGTRDDGAMILVTKTSPPLVVIAKTRVVTGEKPDLLMLHVAEVRGEAHRLAHS